MAKKGKSMVSTDITTADISSMMETNILPIPPVTIVLVPRTVAVVAGTILTASFIGELDPFFSCCFSQLYS